MAIASIRLNQLVETKARILDAARDAVALSGWKDAQIALIAARAGVATGSVYRYFDSKADLYAQVLGLVSEREVAVVAAIVEAEGSASQCLVDAIYTFSIRAMRGRRLAYALIAEPCEPEIDAARLKYRAALADCDSRSPQSGVAAPRLQRVRWRSGAERPGRKDRAVGEGQAFRARSPRWQRIRAGGRATGQRARTETCDP